ncbi:MAG: nucleoside-triphosphatase [Halapricum sp.]
MTHNILVTGPPRSGKTTILKRVRERLEAEGYRTGGIPCPGLRSDDDGDRVGFEIADLMSGDSRVLAHVDRVDGPTVGKYRVNVEGVDAICAAAFERALADADVLIVDEIAPMEVYSEAFVRGVRRGLDADRPLAAAIHYRSTAGFIGEVKARDDTETFDVTDATRDDFPARLVEWLIQALD